MNHSGHTILSRLRDRIANAPLAVSIVAVVLAMAGSATAAKVITGKQIKDGTVTGKDVKDGSLTSKDFNGPVGERGPQGPAGAQGPAGPAGSAVAYAHVTYVGGQMRLDEARSKNVTVTEGPDFVCVDASVPVRNAIAATDFNGGNQPLTTAQVMYDTTGCPAGTDVQVATKRVDTGLLLEPFSVWFN